MDFNFEIHFVAINIKYFYLNELATYKITKCYSSNCDKYYMIRISFYKL